MQQRGAERRASGGTAVFDTGTRSCATLHTKAFRCIGWGLLGLTGGCETGGFQLLGMAS